MAGLIILSLCTPAHAAPISFSSIDKAILKLKVADEVRTGYVRSKFKHWTTVIPWKNGCDSRKVVIIDESIVKPTIGKNCELTGGKWLSIYDNVEVTDASKLDVDHMVPLAEAWDSGALAWTDIKRQQYANDRVDPRHLIAVTGSSNRSKSDQDPAGWVPTNKAYICEYIANWVEIKIRYSLSVDPKEKAALISYSKGCKATKIVVTSF